jgi:hypothetical protein
MQYLTEALISYSMPTIYIDEKSKIFQDLFEIALDIGRGSYYIGM